ncbi:pilus assembly protein [Phyllobacterium endophyticum]|uniref:Pilus assembly protein n=2 Tax=Phyllobacterium endophyticum TaxID=1149773 RepID=A0A2P7B0I1_9HYPH|nr:pilus assembly protein [Phyllobacterium endophyticum]TYR42138.1 pilus assembly protein [Phyllobacterium endophyticum]
MCRMNANKKQAMAMMNLLKNARALLKDKRGVAAIEFALIAPVMIVLYMGSVETTAGIDLNKNLGRATTMVADLVTRQPTITKAEITNIMDIGEAALYPYRRDTPQITITAINVSATNVATVAWSRRKVNLTYTTPYAAGSAVALDANVLIPDTSVIRVEMKIAYVPLMAFVINDTVTTAAGVSAVGLTMPKTSYGRVRQGKSVACSDC